MRAATSDLVRALEELTPDYRTRVVADQTLDLDYVKVRFATRPGDRHVVEINGHDFGGFRKSDLKFLRLLLLAAARKNGKDDGWIDKSRLRDGERQGPRARAHARGPGHLRRAGPERGRAQGAAPRPAGEGLIGWASRPRTSSSTSRSRGLEFVATTTTVKKDGTKTKPTKKQEEGLQNAAVLLRDCRRLGAPGDAEAVKTPSTRGRSTRSAT
jgi:hypothetical protein